MNVERNPEEGNLWLDQADGELRAARVMAQTGYWWQVCRLSHLTAELSLKAVAYYRGDQRSWGHLLDLLLDNVTETFPKLKTLSPDALLLNGYHVPTLYPDASPNGPPLEKYGKEEATEALEAAERVFAAAREIIPPMAK